jgi:hypothetical protein
LHANGRLSSKTEPMMGTVNRFRFDEDYAAAYTNFEAPIAFMSRRQAKPPPASPAADTVIRSGWLKRRKSGIFGHWRPCYCELRGTELYCSLLIPES